MKMRKSKIKKKKRKRKRKRKGEVEERRIKRKKGRRGEERRNGGVTYLVDKLYYKSVNSIAIDNECSRIGLLLVKLKKHDGLVTDYIAI